MWILFGLLRLIIAIFIEFTAAINEVIAVFMVKNACEWAGEFGKNDR